ncbi:hypothetical protein OF83DRAFT_1141209 [Amylostereum chailletii]|nr:hypothetical protein OF83DRAFT_1141209 [Amylostereum chailletii]
MCARSSGAGSRWWIGRGRRWWMWFSRLRLLRDVVGDVARRLRAQRPSKFSLDGTGAPWMWRVRAYLWPCYDL